MLQFEWDPSKNDANVKKYGVIFKEAAEVKMAEDNLRPEYDFSELGNAARGKYAEAYRRGSNLVLLDEDIAKAFPNERAVNDALRLLMNLAKQQAQRNPDI